MDLDLQQKQCATLSRAPHFRLCSWLVSRLSADDLDAAAMEAQQQMKLQFDECDADPTRRPLVEARLSKVLELRRRTSSLLARHRPEVFVAITRRYVARSLPLGADGGPHPKLRAALPLLKLTPTQREKLRRAFDSYDHSTLKVRQEMRAAACRAALVVPGAGADAAVTGAGEESAAAAAGAYLSMLDSASVLEAYEGNEARAMAQLVLETESALAMMQWGRLVAACVPHTMCPLQLRSLLDEEEGCSASSG